MGGGARRPTTLLGALQGALDSDIADIQGGTTREGIHVGAMAGTIDLIQRCYLGLELRANVLYFVIRPPRRAHAG